jgi:hypothetical protein
MFLSLIQGLGFQFATALPPLKLLREAEHILAICLQAITASTDAGDALGAQSEGPRAELDEDGSLDGIFDDRSELLAGKPIGTRSRLTTVLGFPARSYRLAIAPLPATP